MLEVQKYDSYHSFFFFFFHFLELKNGVEKSVLSFKVEQPLKCLALYLQTLQRPSNPKTTYTLLNPFIYMYICMCARARVGMHTN